MPSSSTVFRAIVMIVAGVFVAKGWQLYGPSNEQLKTFAAAAMEKAQVAWNGSPDNAINSPPQAIDPRSAAPPVVADAPPASPPPLEPAPQLVPLTNGDADAGTSVNNAAPPGTAPPTPTADEEAVARLLEQLQQLGAAEAQVGPWGSSGQLFRCYCRAKLSETSPLARHFEAVAGEPTAAVEQVVAKVEAWRTEQQNLLR